MLFVSSNISLKTPGVLEYRSIGVFTSPSFFMQSTIFKGNRLCLLSHLIYLSKPLEYWSIRVLEYNQNFDYHAMHYIQLLTFTLTRNLRLTLILTGVLDYQSIGV